MKKLGFAKHTPNDGLCERPSGSGSGPRATRRGQALLSLAAGLILFVGAAGFGVDALVSMAIKSQLQAAADAAVLAAARVPSGQKSSVADQVFSANFPPGYLMTASRSHGPLAVSGAAHTMTATANFPTLFMRVVGLNNIHVNVTSDVGVAVNAPIELIVIDEDAIDNGTPSIETLSDSPVQCGNGDPAKCVNDDIADPSVRTLLFTRGKDIAPYSGLTLPTGQIGDEGLFRLTNPDPQYSQQNGATFTAAELAAATGAASNENNLDKVDEVTPMHEAEIQAMVGKQFCALVYDSDVSADTSSHYASLKGATMGLTAFTVTAVGSSSGSYLPSITVNLAASADVAAICASARAFGDLSAPSGSSVSTIYRK